MNRIHRTQRNVAVQGLALALVLASPSFGQTSATSASSIQRLVVVSIPDRRLAVLDGGKVIATFSVAVGATASPSPTGSFRVVDRVSNPTYYHPGSVIPSGRDNPIGTRWIGLSQKGYGIHGTNSPRSIGRAASHGCIRLRNRDIEQLFAMLRVGDAVEIHGDRDAQVAQIFGSANDTRMIASAEAPAPAGGGQ
jgi:L,D-transpeptidase ErfK/SrfK